MPYSVKNPPRPAKNWTEAEKAKCVGAANAVLKRGESEQKAIFACIHAAGKTKNPGGKELEMGDDCVGCGDEPYLEWSVDDSHLRFMDRIINTIADYQKADKNCKTEGGKCFPAGDYACVPDSSKPSTWKLRLTSKPGGSPDINILRAAAAAFSPGGHRGNKVQLPEGCGGAKGKVRAAYSKIGKEPPESIKEKEYETSAYIFKSEDDGQYYGVGIVSNNRLDRHEQILTSDSHRRMVKSIDDGSYKAVIGYDKPEIWLWHLPAPIGDAETVTYDERGFLVTAWKQRPDEFSTKAHEVLAEIQDTLGMSHSFPALFTEFDKDSPNLITGYFPREFTLLPLQKAANWLTGTAAIMFKEDGRMQIPDHKREWFASQFGEEFVAELDKRLDLLEQAADAARLPKKELDMPEDLERQEAAEEEVSEAAENQAETEVEGAAETEAEAEEVAEDAQTGMTPTEFVLPKEAMDEIVKGVKEPFDLILKQVQEMNQTLTGLADRVDKLEKDEGTKIADKAAGTPPASLGTIIARSVIGNPSAQLDYEKERELYRGPDEAGGKDDIVPLGVSSIDELRRQQRANKRVIYGSGFNQQNKE